MSLGPISARNPRNLQLNICGHLPTHPPPNPVPKSPTNPNPKNHHHFKHYLTLLCLCYLKSNSICLFINRKINLYSSLLFSILIFFFRYKLFLVGLFLLLLFIIVLCYTLLQACINCCFESIFEGVQDI